MTTICPHATSASQTRQAARALLGVWFLVAGAQAMSAEVDLRVMETTDLHMHLMDYDYYQDASNPTMGLARTAALILAARREVVNSVLVDNGDLLQGNPMGDYAARGRALRFGEVHPAFKAMNLLGYDVGNIGNHDFNYGLDFLVKALHGADFPYVSANVFIDDGDRDETNDQPYFQPYVIRPKSVVDRDGKSHQLNIGYIGLLPPQIMVWDKDKLSGLVKTRDMVDTARRYVPEMQARGADIIIAITHTGLYAQPRLGMDENAVYYLAKVAGINAIMFGHSHLVFPGDAVFKDIPGVDGHDGTVFGVPAVMPGFWGSHLGIVDLQLAYEKGAWRVNAVHSEARPIYRRENGKIIPLVEPVAGIVNAVRQDHDNTITYMSRKVGFLSAGINSYFALVEDDPTIQLVNNAQLWYARKILQGTGFEGIPLLSAASPFKSGGRAGADYYTDVPQGTVALRNIADLYVYPNDLKIVLLSGHQVVAWLERSAEIFNTIDPQSPDGQWLVNERLASYNFDVIDGITYEIDLTRPPLSSGAENEQAGSGRIRHVMYQGQPLDLKQKFLVVTNSYRAGGGGQFPVLDGSTVVIDAPDKNRDVVAAYFLAHETLNPSVDHNWVFAATTGHAQIDFKTSPKARAYATSKLHFMNIMADGFARFSLTP